MNVALVKLQVELPKGFKFSALEAKYDKETGMFKVNRAVLEQCIGAERCEWLLTEAPDVLTAIVLTIYGVCRAVKGESPDPGMEALKENETALSERLNHSFIQQAPGTMQ